MIAVDRHRDHIARTNVVPRLTANDCGLLHCFTHINDIVAGDGINGNTGFRKDWGNGRLWRNNGVIIGIVDVLVCFQQRLLFQRPRERGVNAVRGVSRRGVKNLPGQVQHDVRMPLSTVSRLARR